MIFKRPILSSLILLAFLAANSQAIEDAGTVTVDQGESLADKLIEESFSEGVYHNEMGFAATPKAQRELEKNKTALNWTMPSTLTGGGASAKASRTKAESSSEEAVTSTVAEETTPVEDTSSATDAEMPPAQQNVTNVGGNWYFTLNDSVERDLALVLFQKGNDVFGSGKIKLGNNTQDVTVSGAITDAALEMNLVTANPITQYKLNLNLSEDWASGEYQAFSASGDSWMGRAEGEKTT